MSLLRLGLAALVLAPQDAGVRELVSRLDDDSIQVRTDAAAELVRLGKAALPELQRCLDASAGERRERLGEILRKIGERDRLSALLRPARRVTLEAADRPVREVLESLSKQSGVPLDLEQTPQAEKVSIAARGVTFWEALDAVCRASGKLAVDLDSAKASVVKAGAYVPCPRRFSGPFAVVLESVEIASQGSFGQPDRYDEMQLHLRAAWENGTRPSFVRFNLLGLSDDTGADLRPAEDEGGSETRIPAAADHLSAATMLVTGRLPDPKAKKLARIRVDVEFGFVLRYGGVTFKEPATSAAQLLECSQFAATLVSGTREQGRYTARIKVEPRPGLAQPIDIESLVLRLRDGKTPPAQAQEMSSDGTSMTYGVVWEIGEKGEPVELSIQTPLEVHLERIPVEFRDVSLE